jgi:hypothetical protein
MEKNSFCIFSKTITVKLLIGCLAICLGITSYYFATSKNTLKLNDKPKTNSTSTIPKKSAIIKLNNVKQMGIQLAHYAKSNKYNNEYFFLIDMKIHSGKKRFYIYNILIDSIEHSGLVTHGGGSGEYETATSFSNVPNSAATSLGKYKIGIEYNGKFGMAFKLHGLDKSNSKAYERFVVLHAHNCVPMQEVYPMPICTSLGCPTVSPNFLNILKKYIDNSSKPILLYIYKSN